MNSEQAAAIRAECRKALESIAAAKSKLDEIEGELRGAAHKVYATLDSLQMEDGITTSDQRARVGDPTGARLDLPGEDHPSVERIAAERKMRDTLPPSDAPSQDTETGADPT